MWLTVTQVAEKLGYSRSRFSMVIQHQEDFPKPFKPHPKARPKWREDVINAYINRLV
jgi:predicted DNA-binding transcriptional regulator AlpA